MASTAHASVEIDGGQLRELRKLRGKSVSALAREIKVSTAYLSLLETKPRRCSPEVFARLCTALHVTTDAERLALMLRIPRSRSVA